MGRGVIEPERPVKVTDLLIRQKAEAMILWAYSALRRRCLACTGGYRDQT